MKSRSPESSLPGVMSNWLIRKGPSGYGKTDLCLREMVSELEKDPFGDPLLFITPKQSTFEMERAILARLSRPAFSRLHILSFERLAQWITLRLDLTSPEFLSDEGRLMVLRSLLNRRGGELTVFRSGARAPGFARQLNEALTEFQTIGMGPEAIRNLAEKVGDHARLKSKLSDAALVFERYSKWIEDRGLQDASQLLRPTIDELNKGDRQERFERLKIQRIWVDGFIEYTPIQIDILTALARVGASGVVTIPWDENQELKNDPRFKNLWFGARRSVTALTTRLNGAEGVLVKEEILGRKPEVFRFKSAPPLEHLEKYWVHPQRYSASQENAAPVANFIEGTACLNPEQEVREAARKIRSWTRQGLRYRQIAILTRSPEAYEPLIRRFFPQYEIPYFLDHREPVGGHPLAELTRDAMNLAAREWRNEDWFSALKTGLIEADLAEIDSLENAALEYGWEGKTWLEPLPEPDRVPENFENWERWRQEWVAPFVEFKERLQRKPTGLELAEAVRGLWERIRAEEILQEWSASTNPPAVVHETVWKHMQTWLENVEMAFAQDSLPLRDWVGILESGLENLTVGLIPPALDQVVIGDLERARVFNIHSLIALGMNDGVFPKRPSQKGLLTESDRKRLFDENIPYLATRDRRWCEEEALAYNTWTRPERRLSFLFSQRDGQGVETAPSPYLRRIQRLFPQLKWEAAPNSRSWWELESPNEIFEWIAEKMRSVRAKESKVDESKEDWLERFQKAEPLPREVWGWIEQSGQYQKWDREWESFRKADKLPALDEDLADRLYGTPLTLAVSHLEKYAQCPFQFFSQFGLKAKERKKNDLDRRAQGSFQHDILAKFHEELTREGLRWRDVEVDDADKRIRRIGEELMPNMYHGALTRNSRNIFTARTLIQDLGQFVQVWIRAMQFYQLDPAYVELKFGMKNAPLPAWELKLNRGKSLLFQGIVDRIDLAPNPNGAGTLVLALDYKSGTVKPDPQLMKIGAQLQLPSYLAMLWRLDRPEKIAPGPLIPLGLFFSKMRGAFEAVDVAPESEEISSVFKAFQLKGRFRYDQLDQLDNRVQSGGDFIPYRLKKDGTPYANSSEPISPNQFEQLLQDTEQTMVDQGNSIYSGQIDLHPIRQGAKSACDYCLYESFCRKDPEQMNWREV